MIFVLTNVQLRSIFEEHKLGSVWKHLPFSKKFNFWAFSMHLPHTPSYLYVSSYFFFMRTVSASCSVVLFAHIWNSMEYVLNLDDIWRYSIYQKLLISELNGIWWHLTIIWRYLTTETLTLELENYRPKDIVNFVIYRLVGTEL